jgi:hypothetical protein
MDRRTRNASLGFLSLALWLVTACSPKDSADGGAAAGGGAAPSASAGGGRIDAHTLGTYPLTMDKLNRTTKAAQNIEAAEKADPTLEDRWQKDNDGNNDLDDISTDLPELIARIEAEPTVRRAVESAGISPRDFVLTTFAIMSASVASEMRKSGVKQDSGLGSHVSDDNVAFVTAHKQEIATLMQAAK